MKISKQEYEIAVKIYHEFVEEQNEDVSFLKMSFMEYVNWLLNKAR